MPYADLPTFMTELRADGNLSSLALQFLILTATLTSEVLQARWEEIDREARTWTVPASRMKSGSDEIGFRCRMRLWPFWRPCRGFTATPTCSPA